ncbi:MAG: protein CpxP [Bradymonadia bacterium]|jgi:protein CpxP
MRTKRILILALTVLGVTATAGTAFAWFGKKGGHHAQIQSFINWRVSQVMDDIDATPAQRARIDTIKARMFALGAEHAKSRPDVHTAFMAHWEMDKPDARAVHALVDERIDEIRSMAHQATDAALEIHGTLTVKQRTEIANMIAERLGH